MIKSVLVELERSYDEGNPAEKEGCVDIVKELASELGVGVEESDSFSALCRSVEQRVLIPVRH